MKKILIATDSFLPRWDGISRFLIEILPRIAYDYNVTIVAPDFPGNKVEIPHIKIVRIPIHGFKLGDFSPAKIKGKVIKELVRNTDIVWCQTIGIIGALAIRHARKLKKPVLAYTHSYEWELVSKSLSRQPLIEKIVYTITKRISRNLYNKCDLLIVPSLENASLLKLHGIKTPKTVVYLGTDTNKFRPPEGKRQAKQAIGLNPDDHVIGYTGRIAREKDLATLYRAFVRVNKKHPDTTLLIVGEGIRSEKERLGRHPKVKLAGSQDNIVPYLQAMDIFVLPSLTETSSLSTMEAMSCALPVIATPVGFVKKYIQDKVNGMLFPKKNYLVLSLKLEQLLKDPSLRNRLGENARHTIIQKFPWEKTAEKIENILDKY